LVAARLLQKKGNDRRRVPEPHQRPLERSSRRISRERPPGSWAPGRRAMSLATGEVGGLIRPCLMSCATRPVGVFPPPQRRESRHRSPTFGHDDLLAALHGVKVPAQVGLEDADRGLLMIDARWSVLSLVGLGGWTHRASRWPWWSPALLSGRPKSLRTRCSSDPAILQPVGQP
jgi:hypothetical protein